MDHRLFHLNLTLEAVNHWKQTWPSVPGWAWRTWPPGGPGWPSPSPRGRPSSPGTPTPSPSWRTPGPPGLEARSGWSHCAGPGAARCPLPYPTFEWRQTLVFSLRPHVDMDYWQLVIWVVVRGFHPLIHLNYLLPKKVF